MKFLFEGIKRHILGYNTLLSDCFLIWHDHRYGWEDGWKAKIGPCYTYNKGIVWSLKPPPPHTHTPNSKNKLFSHYDPYMQNWLLSVFLCCICPNCDEVCICWHFGTPGFYVRAPGPRKNGEKKCVIFWIFISKGFLSNYFHVHNVN